MKTDADTINKYGIKSKNRIKWKTIDKNNQNFFFITDQTICHWTMIDFKVISKGKKESSSYLLLGYFNQAEITPLLLFSLHYQLNL